MEANAMEVVNGGGELVNQVLVDALPYIDHGYDEPGVREAVCIKYGR